MTTPTAHDLSPLRQALDALRAQSLTAHAFSALAREQSALLAALPPAYATVWHGLLDRLESGALFSEESCAFSRTDLARGLQEWVAATAKLDGLTSA